MKKAIFIILILLYLLLPGISFFWWMGEVEAHPPALVPSLLFVGVLAFLILFSGYVSERLGLKGI